jgi:hypothetical protein
MARDEMIHYAGSAGMQGALSRDQDADEEYRAFQGKKMQGF